MTVDQSLTPFAPDLGEASSRFGWLSTEEINEALGETSDDLADILPEALTPPPAFPAWPRVYPGL